MVSVFVRFGVVFVLFDVLKLKFGRWLLKKCGMCEWIECVFYMSMWLCLFFSCVILCCSVL